MEPFLNRQQEDDPILQWSLSEKTWLNSNTSIIGQVLVTDKNVSLNPSEVIKQVNRQWVNLISTFSTLVLDNGCCLISFKFENEKDKKWVMDSRPWLVFQNQYLLVLKESHYPSPNVPAQPKMLFTTSPFWIQAHHIPGTVTITEDFAFKMGGVSGYQVLEVDYCERKRKRNNCLRIRALVDVTKRLATGFWLCVSRDHNEVYWVSYRYEDLAKKLCYRCGVLGHDEGSCVNDELARVPVEEMCIVNFVANSGAYKDAVPARCVVDGKSLEEGENERGYGAWLYEEEGQDYEEEEEDDSEDDGDEDSESDDEEDGVFDGDDESFGSDSDEGGDEFGIDTHSCITSQSPISGNTP